MRCRAVLLWLAFALAVPILAAQELDTAHFSQKKATSLPDNAESEAERTAFAALTNSRSPGEKKSLALAFVARFPASWLLSSAWQAAAAACVELNDNACVIEYGHLSLALTPENPLLLIAVARAETLQGQLGRASQDARDALLWLSVLAGPAGVPPREWETTRRSLEEYARRMTTDMPSKLQTPERPGPLNFAGSQSCEPCHGGIYRAWQATGMAKMLQLRNDAKVLADFSRMMEFPNGPRLAEVRTGGNQKPFFEFRLSGGGWKRFSVDYVIGSKWQQAYATALPDGRFFVFPLQFNARTNQWLNYWEKIDPPGSARARISRFPELTEATSYQRNCGVCHTSQLRLTRSEDVAMEQAEFREPGVNCEMCHGASASHVAEMTSGKIFTASSSPPLRFAGLDHLEATLICGQCHRQSALRRLGAGQEMNYTTETPFFVRLQGETSAQFSPRAVYKDGRFRETTYIGEAFMRSACFLRGTAQCASCHNPHPANAVENPLSLKFPQDPDRMCLQCHPYTGAQASAHTRHAADSPGSRCAACHMPPVMNALLFRAASHQISDIPRADLTARFGREQSPNACLICHGDKDVNWLKEQLGEYRKRG